MVKRHNHFKIGINDPELLHYRSGKSKFIFVNVQNPCLHPPLVFKPWYMYVLKPGYDLVWRSHTLRMKRKGLVALVSTICSANKIFAAQSNHSMLIT